MHIESNQYLFINEGKVYIFLLYVNNSVTCIKLLLCILLNYVFHEWTLKKKSKLKGSITGVLSVNFF